jgi:hypothetical protein
MGWPKIKAHKNYTGEKNASYLLGLEIGENKAISEMTAEIRRRANVEEIAKLAGESISDSQWHDSDYGIYLSYEKYPEHLKDYMRKIARTIHNHMVEGLEE